MRASRGDVAVSKTLRAALRIYFALFLVFLYLPTALLVMFSFNSASTPTFPLERWTTHWYRWAFSNHDIVSAVENSLKVAVAVGVIATLIGLGASYALARRNIRMKAAISALILVPLVVPTIALGIALLLLFKKGPLPIPLGLEAVAIGHIVLALPYTVLLILPRISAIDRRLEEAAHDLGASGMQTFRYIIFPLIVPSLLAAFLIAFIVSVDEVVVAVFVLSSDQLTYPVYLFAGLRRTDIIPQLIPVASVMILLSFAIAFMAEVLRRRGERRLGTAP